MMSMKEKAISLFHNGYNCAQSVVCAYAGLYCLDIESSYRVAAGFGLGVGGVKGICGTVSGMVMVASLHTCNGIMTPNLSRENTYPIVQNMLEAFRNRNACLDCETLLKLKDQAMADGQVAGCDKYVEDCCDIIEEYLKDGPMDIQ